MCFALTTFGIISAAFLIVTSSNCAISSLFISSKLYIEARPTILPDSATGSIIATGVTTPVLPIENSTSFKIDFATSGGNL